MGLLPLNQKAYEVVVEHLKTAPHTCVIHPTGTGKSYIALQMIEDNCDARILHITPYYPALKRIFIFNKIGAEQPLLKGFVKKGNTAKTEMIDKVIMTATGLKCSDENAPSFVRSAMLVAMGNYKPKHKKIESRRY